MLHSSLAASTEKLSKLKGMSQKTRSPKKTSMTEFEVLPFSALEAMDLDETLKACPSEPGVYVMKDAAARVIYVGKAKNLKSRVRSYFQAPQGQSIKTQHLMTHVKGLEYVRTGTEVEALLLENTLIKKWKPRYNILLKDDKTYPYIKLDLAHRFPRAMIARRQIKGDGAEYFGPFPMARALRGTLRVASQVFQLRDCRDHEFANRSRPCLSFEIGACTAPCVGKVDQEQYARQIDEFRRFLKGEDQQLKDTWADQMEAASQDMRFEEAARLRDRIQALEASVLQNQRIVDTENLGDRDFWALYPEVPSETDSHASVLVVQIRAGKWMGQVHRSADLLERLGTEEVLLRAMLFHYAQDGAPEKVLVPPSVGTSDLRNWQEALTLQAQGRDVFVSAVGGGSRDEGLYALVQSNAESLFRDREAADERRMAGLEAVAKLLDLSGPPHRIECVDVSNFQGEANVASAVVFVGGRPATSEYRHYSIQGFSGQNDFASMKELMWRRFGKNDPNMQKPDLLVIDGGRGQLASVMTVLKELGAKFPVVALAKARTESDFRSSELSSSEERIFVPGQKNPLKIRSAEALRILTHIRDEAHRFAISFHRLRRDRERK